MPFILIDDDLVVNIEHIVEVHTEAGGTTNENSHKGETKIVLADSKAWWLKNYTPVEVYAKILAAEKTEEEREIARLETMFEERGL